MQKVVSLIGADTTLGFSLKKLKYRVFSHSDLDIRKPKQYFNIINKGNPDTFIICYSNLDSQVSLLYDHYRMIQQLGKHIIIFLDECIYDGYQDVSIHDEFKKPLSETEQGRSQIVIEDKLIKNSNCLIFRVGRFWAKQTGYLHNLVHRTDWDWKVSYSLTSEETLLAGVSYAIDAKISWKYNLVDKGIVTDYELGNFINGNECESESDYTLGLDGRRWEGITMTEAKTWQEGVMSWK